MVLDVDVGRYLDTSLIQADVQPRAARLLIKGRLLQLALPQEASSGAQRAAGQAWSGTVRARAVCGWRSSAQPLCDANSV